MKRKIILLLITLFACISLFLGNYLLGAKSKADQIMAEVPITEKMNEYLNSENYIEFSEINSYFVEAVIATEDKRFLTRKGLDWIALIRAIFVNTIRGKNIEGGSTITQQIAKNFYFQEKDRGIKEKVEEVFIMHELENNYNKEQLFSVYACMNYYGDGYWGLKNASIGYYSENQENLSLAKCAMLAGLPNAPSRLQLSTGYALAKQRQEKVLLRMLEEKYILQEQYSLAITENVKEKS